MEPSDADALGSEKHHGSEMEVHVSQLAEMKCVPCRGGVPALSGKAIEELLSKLDKGWSVVQEHHLTKTYPFNDFAQALAFVNRVGAVAEAEGHHPDLHLSWGRVRIDIWTHKANGLTESDFILAAKADRVL